jgi:histidyl-tRNA synthetase
MEVQTLKGFRDYPPEEMLVRDAVLDRVKAVFESFGYAPLHTPALEYAELLLGKYGDEGEKLLYKFEDHGGRMVALRYDLTVPLARFIACNPNLVYPFRRYHIAPVWRAERPQKGRFREFYQCDVDLVGIDSAQADAECLLVDHAVMKALGISGHRILFNHRGFLDGLLAHLGVGREKVVPVLRVLDKVDKVSRDDMARDLVAEGLDTALAATLCGLSDLSGTNTERLSAALALAGDQPAAVAAVERLKEVVAIAEASSPGLPIQFAPSIARGLDYYTGIVYETFLPARYGVGSVMSGGRYDTLLGTFSGRQTPAVGISLGIDRLLSALSGSGEAGTRRTVHVLVCCVEGSALYAARVAGTLRAELSDAPAEIALSTVSPAARVLLPSRLGVELYPKAAKLKKQMEYADRKGIPLVVLAGAEEEAAGVVTVKRLRRHTPGATPPCSRWSRPPVPPRDAAPTSWLVSEEHVRDGTQQRVALADLARHVLASLAQADPARPVPEQEAP